MANPRLPPEIECIIFQHLAREYLEHDRREESARRTVAELRRDMTSLYLIAKRVESWALETFFSAVWIFAQKPSDSSGARLVRAGSTPIWGPLSKVGQYVRYLRFEFGTYPSYLLPEVLKCCVGVTELYFGGTYAVLPLYEDLLQIKSLKRLQFSYNWAALPLALFKKLSLNHITHIHVWHHLNPHIVTRDRPDDLDVFHQFAHITIYCNANWTLALVLNMIRRHPNLVQAMIIVDPVMTQEIEHEGLVEDNRIILLGLYHLGDRFLDLKERAYGGFDLWKFGETISKARRHSYLKDNAQRIIPRNFYWEQELTERGLRWYKGLSLRDHVPVWRGDVIKQM